MRLIVISKSENLKEKLTYHFTPLGFTVDVFNDPLLLIDEIDHINFDVLLFDANDFPRHWKPIIKLLREYKSKEKAVVILSRQDGFPFEEASKAIHLEINGLISDNLSTRQLMFRLEEILRRYKTLPDNRKFSRLFVSEEDDVTFLFTHPKQLVLIFGEILDISIQGMNFKPYEPGTTTDILPGQTILDGSLRIGKDIITINYTVTRNRGSLGIMFESFGDDGHNKLFHYLVNKPERELKTNIQKIPSPD